MVILSRVKSLLNEAGIDYEIIEHQPVTTSEEAEAVTGWPRTSGAKSIVFKIEDGFVLAVVKGSNRVDFKKLRKHLGTRKARLATPAEVLDVMGVEVGACYPFWQIAGIPGIVDDTLQQLDQISFSPGTKRHHIRLSWQDYQKLTNPQLVDLVLEE